MTTTRRQRRPATDRQRLAGIIGILAVAALSLSLLVATSSPAGHVVDDREGVEMTDAVHSGTTHEVRLPTATVGIRVGDPVDEVERRVVDLPSSSDPYEQQDSPVRAPDGQVLLPVTWSVAPRDSVTDEGEGEGEGEEEDQSTGSDQNRPEVTVRLIVDDETTQLIDDHLVESVIEDGAESRLIAVDDGTEISDVTVEVTSDGLTQTLTPEDGDVDSGAAAPLYDEDARVFNTTCGDDDCRMRAADDSTVRLSADGGAVTAGELTLEPYRRGLGWADKGTTWASVQVTLGDSSSFYRSDGERRGQKGTPKTSATLDGVTAKDITWIYRSTDSKARLTFPVDVGHTPRTLTITQEHTLDDRTSTTVTTREQITIRGGK